MAALRIGPSTTFRSALVGGFGLDGEHKWPLSQLNLEDISVFCRNATVTPGLCHPVTATQQATTAPREDTHLPFDAALHSYIQGFKAV